MDPSKPHNARALRVLVVEDEALIAMMLEDMLEDLGHDVAGVAGNMDSALKLLESGGDALDAAVVDANLGGVSAAPIAEALRAVRVPFILASGYDGDELARLGFDEPTLRKPYRKQEVARLLSQIAGTPR